jgi:hypothetical protein
MNNHVHRMLCRKYEQSCRLMVDETKGITNDVSLVKSDIVMEYKENLRLLREFLDNSGIRMPKPKWHFNAKDPATWLFTADKELNKKFMMLQRRKR